MAQISSLSESLSENYQLLKKDTFLAIFFSLYIVCCILIFWRNSIITLTSLLLGNVALLYFWHVRGDILTVILAMMIGTVTELGFVKNGVWKYHNVTWSGIPIWLPFVWGYLILLFSKITGVCCEWTARISFSKHKLAKTVLFLLFSVIGLTYCSVVLHVVYWNIGVFYLIFLSLVILFWHHPRDIALFCIGGVLGTTGEYLCMQAGIWTYSYPYFKSLGLPISLPLSWGVSTVIIRRISQLLARTGQTEYGTERRCL